MPADKPEGEAADFLVTHWNKRIWLTYDRLFGFLLGATTSGAGMYYYVIDEYRVSNELLTEDIYVSCYPSTHTNNQEEEAKTNRFANNKLFSPLSHA